MNAILALIYVSDKQDIFYWNEIILPQLFLS